MFSLFLGLTVLSATVRATEFNVAINGIDANEGTASAPFRTIQHAANVAQPGDVITVHAGVYRERIDPPRGGTSDANRITYQAAPGDHVVITGSEPATNWIKVSNDTWRVTIPNSFFLKFNPYRDLIHGDWFDPMGRQHHTGAVYLNGDWLAEARSLDDVLAPVGATPPRTDAYLVNVAWIQPTNTDTRIPADRFADKHGMLWFGLVDGENTTIWAQFPGVNPNRQHVEINVRQTVFTPARTGVNYLTVRGFDLRDAATPWAPPTAGQVGLITANWCKGWIIESNTISFSTCCGVALGKYSDAFDNQSANTAEGYVGTIHRALSNGWNQATIGSHRVRGNTISHCEQTGIVGSLGCAFSTVTGNVIHDIHMRALFGGAEMAGIKFHGAIDATISHNHIYRCGSVAGIWLDWMAQGCHVTGNLMHDNSQDVYFEMQHGPILVANNLFLSRPAFSMNSQGIAFVHNLIAGQVDNNRGDTRVTPFLAPHGTTLAGMYPSANGDSGDHRFFNNVFVASCDLHAIDESALPCFAAGNVFTRGTKPSKFDRDALVLPDFNAGVTLTEKPDGWFIHIIEDQAWREEAKCRMVTTEYLGKAKVSGCANENADGSRVREDTDYFGRQRDDNNPFPGPFAHPASGEQALKVW